MNYKEGFQLAQDKGYKLMYIPNAKLKVRKSFLKHLEETNAFLIELTLIQKWLRDEHKMEVTVKHNPHSQGNIGLWEWQTSPIFEKGHILMSIDTPKKAWKRLWISYL